MEKSSSRFLTAGRKRVWFWLAIVFLLALSSRLLVLGLMWDGLLANDDTPAYEKLAKALVNRQPYSTVKSGALGAFPGDLVRPPGYPLFLALVSPSLDRHRSALAQCFLGALFACLLAYLTGRLLSPAIGLLAGILFAVDWVSIVVTQIITADSLVAPLIALSVLAFAFHLKTGQLWQAIAAGLLLGGSALVKPVAQIVVPIFVISWFFSRPRRRTGLVFLLLYVLVAVPWMLRNQRTYGMFTLSTIGTVDLYFYIAQGAKQDVSILRDPFGRDFQRKLNQLHIKEWESRSYDSELDRKRRMEEESWPIVRQYWPRVLKWGAVGAARVALGVSRTNADWLRAPHPPLPKFWTMVLPTAQVLGMWLFAAFAVLHRRREGGIPKNLKILISGTILALLVAASGPVGYSQYRVPLAPLLCILTACGLVQARQRLRKSVPEPAVAEALAAG